MIPYVPEQVRLLLFVYPPSSHSSPSSPYNSAKSKSAESPCKQGVFGISCAGVSAFYNAGIIKRMLEKHIRLPKITFLIRDSKTEAA